MTDMTYTRLGNSGLIVSRLALGTMTFNLGGDFVPGVAKTGQDDASRMVDMALERGINFFDTANGYSQGDAEVALGVALKNKRHDAVICTKIGFRQSERVTNAGLSRAHIRDSVQNCLRRLGTDYIDLLVVHKTDFTTPQEETLSALDQLVREGTVRYIGCSNWPAWEVARAVQYQRDNGLAQFVAGQYLYNLVGRDIEVDVLRMADQMGVGLMAWSPLAAGLLTGKYDLSNLESNDGRLSEGDFLNVDKAVAAEAIAALSEIGTSHGKTPAQIALSWILHRDRSHTVIIGASKPDHLATSLEAAGISLSDQEIARLDFIAAPGRRYPEWFADMMKDELHTKALS